MRAWRNIPRTAGPVRLLGCSICLALAAGCQPAGPEALYHTYLNKLSAALSVAVPVIHSAGLFSPPPAEALRLDIPGGTLDHLDFLALSGCAVQATILKRNSGLGRAARSSQRLLLGLEYLRLAPPCIAQLRDSGDPLADTLQDAWLLQREQLPALIFNATLGGDEYRAFWQPNPTPGEYPRVKRRVALAALAAINHHVRRWLGGDYRARNRDFEILLGEVAGGRGGKLVEALSRQGDWLASADLLVEHRVTLGLPCFAKQREVAASVLPATIHHYFVDMLQPPADRLEQHYHQFLPLITGLEDQLGATLPERYRSWMEQRNQHLAAVVSAPRHHLQQLGRLQHCTAQ